MAPRSLGRTLVVANPAAHSGRGEGAAIFAMRFFSSFHSATTSCEVRLTEGMGDALGMARDSVGYDTVIALGGDGVIHEVVNGLMSIPSDDRPRLGVIPMGSGNDFARTLNMRRNDPQRAIAELLEGQERVIDVGRVNDTYFAETVSFGLDAAIAIDTNERRVRNTMQSGAILFVTSGVRLIANGLRGWPFRAVVDDEVIEGMDVTFAIQNGRTYGGGFRICPDAVPNDGVLDLCMTIEKASLPHSLALFALARVGRHVRSRKMMLRQVKHVEVEFLGDDQPLCQVDGEPLCAQRYVIDVVPRALTVLVPSSCVW